MASWPAIIKFSGDDELTYIADLQQWKSDTDLHFFGYQQDDMLIDSCGMIHHLNQHNVDLIMPQPTGALIDLGLATTIVQAHYSSIRSCCAAKIFAPSVAQLIELIGEENN